MSVEEEFKEEPEERRDRRKLPSQETIENTMAISKLTTLQENTTKDIDRLIKHIDKTIVLPEKIANTESRIKHLEDEAEKGIRPTTLKVMLYIAFSIAITFGAWTVLEINYIEINQASHEATQTEREKNVDSKIKSIEASIKDETGKLRKSIEQEIRDAKEEVVVKMHHNKNQITYLKGRIK